MRRRWLVILAIVVSAVAIGGFQATAGGPNSFESRLSGYQEVPTLSVSGTGEFSAQLTQGGTALEYTLTYTDLTGPASAAHIHLGKRAIAGGVIAFLCGGGEQDPCPGASGSVSGTIEAADVIGPADQGIAEMEFEELVQAMRTRAAYVNVHTEAFPDGEIRGQIR
jgi:hypothetical protein